jgi:AcrR family transcriptional regulator
MRYKPGQKAENRQALLKASSQLAKEKGFAATGVDALMRAAGVTSGAFYSHFKSKSDLLQALVETELSASREMVAGNPHESGQAWLAYELDRYLSLSHVRHPEAGCVLPPLAAEIARSEPAVRELYATEMDEVHRTLAARLGDSDLAWGLIGQLVGTILIARAMPDEASQSKVLEASKRALIAMTSAFLDASPAKPGGPREA